MIPPIERTHPPMQNQPIEGAAYWHLLWLLVVGGFCLFQSVLQKACRVFFQFQHLNQEPSVNNSAINLYDNSSSRWTNQFRSENGSLLEEHFRKMGDRVKIAFKIVKEEFIRRFAPPSIILERLIRANIPILEAKLLDRIEKLTRIRKFVEEDPKLLEMVSKRWNEFLPHYIPLIDIEKQDRKREDYYSHVTHLPRDPENNMLHREYFLRTYILNCKVILENYQTFLQYYPEVEKAIRKRLEER